MHSCTHIAFQMVLWVYAFSNNLRICMSYRNYTKVSSCCSCKAKGKQKSKLWDAEHGLCRNVGCLPLAETWLWLLRSIGKLCWSWRLQDVLSGEDHSNSGFYCACWWHLGERYLWDSLSNHHVVEKYPSPIHTVFWHLENVF